MKNITDFNPPKAVKLQAIRWYLAYTLSYHDVESLLIERGFHVNQNTIHGWVLEFAHLFEARETLHKRRSNGRLRLDETCIQIQGAWLYLYRAINTSNETVDFILTPSRDATTTNQFLKKIIRRNGKPRLINRDKRFNLNTASKAFQSTTHSRSFIYKSKETNAQLNQKFHTEKSETCIAI